VSEFPCNFLGECTDLVEGIARPRRAREGTGDPYHASGSHRCTLRLYSIGGHRLHKHV